MNIINELTDSQYNILAQNCADIWGIKKENVFMSKEHYYFGLCPTFKNSLDNRTLFFMEVENYKWMLVTLNVVKKLLTEN